MRLIAESGATRRLTCAERAGFGQRNHPRKIPRPDGFPLPVYRLRADVAVAVRGAALDPGLLAGNIVACAAGGQLRRARPVHFQLTLTAHRRDRQLRRTAWPVDHQHVGADADSWLIPVAAEHFESFNRGVIASPMRYFVLFIALFLALACAGSTTTGRTAMKTPIHPLQLRSKRIFLVLFLIAIACWSPSRAYTAQWDITPTAAIVEPSQHRRAQEPAGRSPSPPMPPTDPRLGDVRKIIREFISSTAMPTRPHAQVHRSGEQPQQTGRPASRPTAKWWWNTRTQRAPHQSERADADSLLTRLARAGKRMAFYLDGHGNASSTAWPTTISAISAGSWSQGSRRPASTSPGPGRADNASLLMIASPQVDLMPGEVEKLQKFWKGVATVVADRPGAAARIATAG